MKTFSSAVRTSDFVCDLRAVLHGEAQYFIVKVPSAKRAAFLRAVENDAGFCLEDFGEVLHRGWDEPDEALKTQINNQYGLYK